MTKKEQTVLLRNALLRLHFHQTISHDTIAFAKVLDTLLQFTEDLGRAEDITEDKDRKTSVEQCYKLLENLP